MHPKLTRYQDLELSDVLEKEVYARARSTMLGFTRFTMPSYEINWHHRILCQYLDKFASREIPRLMVFMPPRHGKSELVSRRLPPFLLGHNPEAQIMGVSYSGTLASDMTVDQQRIIDTREYQALFPHTKIMPEGQRLLNKARSSTEYDIIDEAGPGGTVIPHNGRYLGLGVGGAVTGRGADFEIVDDPIKNQEEADSLVYRERLWKFYTSTLYTRLEKNGSILITLTRWHLDDLAGRLLKAMMEDPTADPWVVISFPAVRDSMQPIEPYLALSNDLDPRRLDEGLWPGKYDRKKLVSIRGAVGQRVWDALYAQRPTSATGGMIKRAWIQHYKKLPAHLDRVILSMDATFEDGPTKDYCVIQAWAKAGGEYFLLDQVRAQMGFSDSKKALKAMAFAHKSARAKYIEKKANGPAIQNELKKAVSGIILVEPLGSKEARLDATTPLWEAGNVWLPDPSIAPWIKDYVEELVNFPQSPHDDQVDSTSQALLKLGDSRDNVLKAITES